MVFQFNHLVDFINMNGHGSYVWFCYLITFIVILIMIWIPLQRRRQLMAQLKRQLRISEAKALGSNATSIPNITDHP